MRLSPTPAQEKWRQCCYEHDHDASHGRRHDGGQPATARVRCHRPSGRGEIVIGITTSLTELLNGTPVVLTSPPTFTGTSATQPIIGSVLEVGLRYRLVWTFQLSSGIVLGQATFLKVDY